MARAGRSRFIPLRPASFKGHLMAEPSTSRPRAALLLMLAGLFAALAPIAPLRAQEPEFFDVPYAKEQWNYGRRLDESQLRFCVDGQDPDWEVSAEIGQALALALLLEPVPHVVRRDTVIEDITVIYETMLQHCDVFLGFKLIPEGYQDWLTLTRPYYAARYDFVTLDPALGSLDDLARDRPIGAKMGTMAFLSLVFYRNSVPAAERWPLYPMGSNEQALDALAGGRVDVALVWAPTLWAHAQAGSVPATLRRIEPSPLAPASIPVGAVLLSDEIFLRTALDEAIAALAADGTIAEILARFDFPAEVMP